MTHGRPDQVPVGMRDASVAAVLDPSAVPVPPAASVVAFAPARRPRVRILGAQIDDLDFDEAVVAAGTIRDMGGGVVVTCNVDHTMVLRTDAGLRAAYRDAALVTADGVPLVWLSRLLGTPLRCRVTGADLVPALVAVAAERGLLVALVGGAEGVGAQVARLLVERHPDLRPPLVVCPPMDLEVGGGQDEALVGELAAAAPDIVIVCLGMPKQELWAHRHGDRLRPAVLVCAGATLDFLAGHRRRAPVIVQRFGGEWLWRLATDFRRLWRRYLVRDAAFLPLAVREITRVRLTRAASGR